METIEVSAKTVEEAVQLALNEMNLSRSEVEIEVLHEGKTGILGWLGEDARVRVTPLPSPDEGDDVVAIAGEVVEKLLSLMEVDATVQVTDRENEELPSS